MMTKKNACDMINWYRLCLFGTKKKEKREVEKIKIKGKQKIKIKAKKKNLSNSKMTKNK